MTLREVLAGAYAAAVEQRLLILAVSAALPVAGTVLARIGKAGRTDKDGRFIASTVMAVALAAFVVEIVALFLARSAMNASVLEADVVLVMSPLLCLAGCLTGIRWVFPLTELASVRTFLDVGAFVLACAGVVWLFSKFRGWGLVFFGSITEMIAIGGLGIVLLRRLWERASGGRGAKRSPTSSAAGPS